MRHSFTIRKYMLVILASTFISTTFFSACSKDKDKESIPETSNIPSDSEASDPPAIANHILDTYIPNPSFSTHQADAKHILMQMTGIKDPNSRAYIALNGMGSTAQNIWLQVDGKNKGFIVKKNANSGNTALLADIVFTVDNSGSMDSEADTIALQIKNWVNYLATQNLNLKVGIVGYDVHGNISGALNLTNNTELEYYLTKRTTSWGSTVFGTARTVGFYGSDSATLNTEANQYDDGYSVYDENGVMAIKFANDKFAWRPGANRIYVNFTDEPNQPDGQANATFSIYDIRDNWSATSGTIHTVYSADTTDVTWSDYEDERPWKLSEYTGGSAVFIDKEALELNLKQLPVTGALAETFVIEYKNNEGSGQHNVQIFIKSNKTSADGNKLYKNINY